MIGTARIGTSRAGIVDKLKNGGYRMSARFGTADGCDVGRWVVHGATAWPEQSARLGGTQIDFEGVASFRDPQVAGGGPSPVPAR